MVTSKGLPSATTVTVPWSMPVGTVLSPARSASGDHPVRLRRGGKVDLSDGKPEQRVAHGAANGARLDAVAIERVEHGERSRPLQPLGTVKRGSHGAALKILRDHFEFVAA